MKLQVGTRDKYAHWFNIYPGTHAQPAGTYVFFIVTVIPVYSQLGNMTNPNYLQANLELMRRQKINCYYWLYLLFQSQIQWLNKNGLVHYESLFP